MKQEAKKTNQTVINVNSSNNEFNTLNLEKIDEHSDSDMEKSSRAGSRRGSTVGQGVAQLSNRNSFSSKGDGANKKLSNSARRNDAIGIKRLNDNVVTDDKKAKN